MDKNVGGLDRALRLALGPVLLVTATRAILGDSKLKPSVTAGAFAAGAYLAGTGLLGSCPANTAVGRDTARRDEISEEAQTVRDRAIQ